MMNADVTDVGLPGGFLYPCLGVGSTASHNLLVDASGSTAKMRRSDTHAPHAAPSETRPRASASPGRRRA